LLILGISCFYHDSSACLVRDGDVVAAAQEERFSREKNTSAFPIQSIRFCLEQAGITIDQVDHVAYFEKPFLKFSRVLTDHLLEWPLTWDTFRKSMPKWLTERLTLPALIEEELEYKGPISFIKHHLSHASSAFYPSGFEEAAIITADGVGEWATFSVGTGHGSSIKIEKEIHYPDSLGLLYTTVTTFLGFHAQGGEGKTMGLAGYGSPARFRQAVANILRLNSDGSFSLNPKYFSFRRGKRMWSSAWTDAFGVPRKRDDPWTEDHYDLAASVQEAIENVLILNADILQKKTGLKKLCLAGGVTLNCVASAKILESTAFDDIFIQPAAGDAGGSVGAALYVYHSLYRKDARKPLRHAYLGPEFSKEEIRASLLRANLPIDEMDETKFLRRVAQALNENKVIGWFQGRMEFGPRALGNRSILGNPTSPEMKDILNLKIKKRESFRPFAPIVLEERATEFFDLSIASPYMLLAPKVRSDKRTLLPAITHVDGTARVQTCNQTSNPLLRKLIEEFESLSGVPMIINTSFNRNTEPVVATPDQAIDCFLQTQMDLLAIGPYIVSKP